MMTRTSWKNRSKKKISAQRPSDGRNYSPLAHSSSASAARESLSLAENNAYKIVISKEDISTFRTVQVPEGVSEGQLFHVLIKNDNADNNSVIGVTCPKGVKGGNTIIVVEPGCSPPLSPKQIAEMNERRLVNGIDKEKAEWVRISFWKIVWPVLIEEGWHCQKEHLFNFGSVTFFSPTAKHISISCHNKHQMKSNQEYFETISAVLDFIKLFPLKKHLIDSCFADAERRMIQNDQQQHFARRRRTYVALDRWKPKHCRVGSDHQAESLPRAGSFSKGDITCCVLEPIDDPKENESIKPNWCALANDEAFVNKFHNKILETKKQFRLLATSIGMPLEFCLWYYYCKYKTSDNYITLKNLLRKEQGINSDECVICDGGESLLPTRFDISTLYLFCA